MKIDRIKDILSGYGSEKGFDFVISAVRELSKKKQLKENINNLIRSELSTFENTDKNGEYDFKGLIDLLKEFGNESFVESYVYAYIENDSLEKKKELIRKECIRDTNANTQESEKSVRSIIDRCFNIIDEHLLHCLSKEDLIQTGIIKKIIKEISNQNTERIIEGIQDSTKELKELITSKDSHTIQPVCTSPTNDNQAYLDAFTNPLFLENEEEDENVLSLADMYISPNIKNKGIKASECIKKWYGTRTKPCLLIYGDAGVGKSSFVSKILADANGITEKSKTELIFDSSKVMAVALRNHTDNINIQLTAEEILTMLFNCDFAEQLKDKLLILDGLDELCVLKHGFEGKIFLEKLSRLGYGYHVLVTSRESECYFTEPRDEEGLRTERLIWEEKQIKDWLDLYKAQKPRKEKWCIKFHEQLCSLETDDTRREIFCVPIILYICGTSETDIEDHSSIGSIYRDAFTKILLRKHLRGQSNTDGFKEADKEANLIAWQYTKEIAYQMYLHNTIDLIDSDNNTDFKAIGFRNAQKRTIDIIKEKYKFKNIDLEVKKELAVCPFTRNNQDQGSITFAHKSVYEYFAAVKLYEDYFEKFNSSYFKSHPKASSGEYNDDVIKDVMTSYVEAFRYKAISLDILNYLCKLNSPAFNGSTINTESTFCFSKFTEAFISGMKKNFFSDYVMPSRIQEYITSTYKALPINAQLSLAFCNFTHFLTKYGFTNENGTSNGFVDLLSSNHQIADIRSWKLSNANLNNVVLSNGFLEGIDLENSTLEGSILNETFMKDANMKNVKLLDSYLIAASLENTNLEGANLEGSYLDYANLDSAILKNARLDCACFSCASFKKADLSGANLGLSHLEGANFEGATLNKTDLSDAILENANLEEIYSIEANFNNAYMSGATLHSSVLIDSSFESTDLSYAKLVKANMANAYMEEAKLIYANLSCVYLPHAILKGAELHGANLIFADLTNADLTDADLTNTNFIGANLTNTDLTSTNLVGTILADANLEGAVFTNAKYCNFPTKKTIFPDSFNPKEHDMIEVDIRGNPVKDK